MLLLEPRGSEYARRIESAAVEAGLSIEYLESIEAAPPDAPLIGIGPTISDPLHVARHRRARGSQAMLVFFTASTSARAELQAQLVRDPFLYPRFELIEVRDNGRQLASRMGRVATYIKRQLHARANRARRPRSRSTNLLPRGPVATEQLLAHILANSREAILCTDKDGRITTLNQAAERLFSVRADSAIGRTTNALDGVLAATVGAAMAAGETITARGGASGHLALSVAPIQDKHGSSVGACVLASDDAELQHVREALREANRQKDEFLAIMSHELRTPLTSILGYTDMLLRGLSGPLAPLANKYMTNVRAAGDRLLELVNGLLDYTRLEAGVEHLETRTLDIAQLVSQNAEQWLGAARAKGIHLRVSSATGFHARVQADEQKLAHVLRNYLGNALKFTPSGGEVTVSVGLDPRGKGAVRVSVSDNGIGLREEQLGRVWERFYQGDASLTRAYGGMGLGLSIARHLVALHGGTVGAESSGPERGSTFWFTLPSV